MNIIDDVIQMKDVPFEQEPFNEVDSLVFAQLAYFPYETLLKDGEEKAFCDIDADAVEIPKRGKERFKNHIVLMKNALASSRYKDFVVSDFVNERDSQAEKQFCAVCFRNREFVYVSFRGTDATVVGWKEDVNLSFMDAIPAQTQSVAYLKAAAKKFKKHKILTGGHSKGGNLAIYAAAKSSKRLQNRIQAIYSHDGPGFRKEFFLSEGYRRIESKIKKTVPYSSIIGMLLENPTPYDIIDSKSVSIFQHNPYKWIVKDHLFIPKQHLSPSWYYFDSSVNKWIEGISETERKQFFDLVFLFFETANITEFKSRATNFSLVIKNLRQIYGKYKSLDDETKMFLKRTIKELIAILLEDRKNQNN